MKPLEICHHLGRSTIDGFYEELSNKEVRDVLRAGGSHAGVPSTAFTRAQRLKAWRKRFDAEFERGNEQLALALLLEWLMRHHRPLLADFLDHLEVPHRQGETDEDFCETKTPEALGAAADMLLEKYPHQHVATYLLLVGHLQDTPLFDRMPKVLAAMGMSSFDSSAYIAEHEKTWKKSESAA